MKRQGKVLAMVLLIAVGALSFGGPAAAGTELQHGEYVVRHYSFSRSLGVEPLVEIGVGILALVLFAISGLAYYRDRRKKFLIVCLAFLTFAVKGMLGLLDLFYPRDSSFLMTFSDLLDLVILLLLVIAVMKD
jgi:hypothetical protein